MADEWDVSISRATSKDGAIQIVIPSAVARSLRAKGYNRAKLRLTDQGLLFTPYVSDVPRRLATVELPETWQ